MTEILVSKRENRGEEAFDPEKIEKAILNAMKNGSGIISKGVAKNVASEIEEIAKERGKISVPEIENLVYEKLIKKGHKLTAKAYEGYRSVREFQRKKNTIDGQINELLTGSSEYWKSENSNKDASTVTVQRDYMAGVVSIDIARRQIFPAHIIQAHDEGLIHIHDMDYIAQPMYNCCLFNLGDMLENGFVINKTKISKPKRLLTATTIATQAIVGVSSSQLGGVSMTLTHLAPFVRLSKEEYRKQYEGLGITGDTLETLIETSLKKEIKDAVQTFNYQLNSMCNSNGQSPFITLFMYLGETEEYKEELAELIEEFLRQRIEGMPNESGVMVTPAFPKIIYCLEEDNIHETSKYWYLTELAAKCTSRRLVPDYISEKKMKELKDGNCFPSMGCRSFLSPWYDENGKPKFYGRFNQGVVTISLPDVGLSAGRGEIDKFFEILDERLELCHEALRIRHKQLRGVTSDVSPILWQYGAIARLEKGQTIDDLLVGGYSTISLGYAGLYECVYALTGESHTKQMELAERIMQRLNDACEKWKQAENGLGYSVYGTPIESTTYKFAKSLKSRFGNVPGVTDHGYITNSYHVNVKEKISPLNKIKVESELQKYSLGGMISYIEAGDMTDNPEAVLQVIKYIYDNIAYAEINIKSDYCSCCGYSGEIKIKEKSDGTLFWECPECGCTDDSGKLHIARRTCGYIGSNLWNQGRTQEIRDRYVHAEDHELDD